MAAEISSENYKEDCRIVQFGKNVYNEKKRKKSIFSFCQKDTFPSNEVKTSKYNIMTFLPRFFMEQFRSYSNMFFLCVCLIQQLPVVSPTGKYTVALPLCCILIVSAVKEIIEDVARHRQDHLLNHKPVDVFIHGCWKKLKWSEVKVGDIVKFNNNDQFPADVVLISTSEPQSIGYVETSNLDGETNLKIKQADSRTSYFQSREQLADLKGHIRCDKPNRNIYSFNGALHIDGQEMDFALGPERVLLRGSALKNTEWALGIVIYTGHETKLMKNMRTAPSKKSNVDTVTNYQMLILFGLMLLLSILSSFFSNIWIQEFRFNCWYIKPDLHKDYSRSNANYLSWFLLDFFSYIILYNNLVPISLKVTLELVKFFQSWFINNDIDLYDAKTDTPTKCRTSHLNEELGQVKYLLSDKTGTLTQNIMTFKKTSICGNIYGNTKSEKFDDVNVRRHFYKCEKDERVVFEHFLTALAVCHTVVPNYSGDSANAAEYDWAAIQYQASSPDEAALVRGARNIGVVFHSRTPDSVHINFFGDEQVFHLLHVLEFTSHRKRMSVIYRCPDGRIRLYIKGADNVIFERLLKSNQQFKSKTLRNLELFSLEGLRTLCYAYREIDTHEYAKWNALQHEASLAIVDHDAKLAAAAELIEKNLILIGASGIEDQLQDNVRDTIVDLMRADIRVWVLTGDKRETAINIGRSCGLLDEHTPVIQLASPDAKTTAEDLRHYLDSLGTFQIGKDNYICLVIEGETLRVVLKSDSRQNFIDLALSCTSVICCRASPLQKAELVEIVKKAANAITLAIGDGANDVPMIQAAHVGIGITGREGLQAAAAADYTIAQFRFLRKLLFVHGSFCFHRIVKLILYTYYKNITLYITELWFALYSAWSGQQIYEDWSLCLYNVLFTFLSPMAMALFDRPVSANAMLKHPQLYKMSQDRAAFSIRVFSMWLMQALLHSLIIFFLTRQIYENGSIYFNSILVSNMFTFGNTIYTYVLLTVSLKLYIEVDAFTWPIHASVWLGVLIFFLFTFAFSYVWPYSYELLNITLINADFVNQWHTLFKSTVYWLGCFLVPVATVLLDLAFKVLRRTIFTTMADVVKEVEIEEAAEKERRNLSIFDDIVRGQLKEAIKSKSLISNQSHSDENHGYAFSQEENGVIKQSQVARAYNSRREKVKRN